jgi:isoleucyl-tRNA synthetase
MAGGKYKDTVILPETPFPMRGDLARREPEILAGWDRTNLYGRILESRKDAPLFVFHDGPPYTSGNIHYGHILNKILKDIVVKSRTLAGFRVPFVPGFDTHGLPIELHVERELAGNKQRLSQIEIRRECKAFAMKYVGIQTTEFQRLGVLGQWNDPYLTLEPIYEQAVIRALAAFARGGYLYRGKKPVFWCPRDRTALAEFEVEHAPETSPSIYVRFPVAAAAEGGVDPASLSPALAGKHLTLVIWTTTPWTLPANLAIVAHPAYTYLAIPSPRHPDEYLVVVRELAESFVKAIGGDPASVERAVELPPAAMKLLEGKRYHHPFIPTPRSDADFRVWFADYVTAEQGTGLVHTAPGHGAEDYRTGVAHGLDTYAPIDDGGRYVGGVALAGGPTLDGISTHDANPQIVAHLHATGALLNPPTDKLSHSYPHCWRCKGPILFRATPQWFLAIDHAELRARSLAAIDATEWIPKWGKERIHGMIANRPDWVLSRQRLWGVPIPAFYCTACRTEHAEASTMEHVAEVFGAHGADAWWTLPVAELVPPGTTCLGCGAGADKFEREKDIVDVWFESGASWLAMAAKDPADHGEKPGAKPPIDLYLEGSDQHRGWFHSSLLIGVGVRNGAPYKEVITHGFVLDENGIPYSKSTILKAKAEGKKTSYIEPDDVIKKSGAELFRLWVGSTEFRNDIPYSQDILDRLSDWYRKLRNTARFLLGAVADFDPVAAAAGPDPRMSTDARAVDRYMLGRIDDLVRRGVAAYQDYDFHLVHRALVDFVSVDLSALYADVVKDRLYCDAADSPARRAAQAVIYEALRAITTLAAPILCFTMEDVWTHLPKRTDDPDSVHVARFPEPRAALVDDPLARDFAVLLAVRDAVTKELEAFRAQKRKSIDAIVTVSAPPAERAVLERHADELADLFIVSDVVIGAASGAERVIGVADHPGPRCERCWRHVAALDASFGDVCTRCAAALRARGMQP